MQVVKLYFLTPHRDTILFVAEYCKLIGNFPVVDLSLIMKYFKSHRRISKLFIADINEYMKSGQLGAETEEGMRQIIKRFQSNWRRKKRSLT